MALREIALYKGTVIGIETIFTVIDGKQINIPEKIKDLRQKSRNNELFCPCGCGANLTLVAGDKNLREQHFRLKDGQNSDKCTFTAEGKKSVESKIVLKCWLDDKLRAEDLESRVPICDVSESDRRYEFTFISRNRRAAVDYCHNRINLSDEKQSILEQNGQGIRIIHIVDNMNGGIEGQYPESLMKLQARQKYCLLLSVEDIDYDAAEMRATFYDRDIDGLWQEVEFADGLLNEYRIDSKGKLFFRDKSLLSLLDEAVQKFNDSIEREKKRREEDKRREEEEARLRAEEDERLRAEEEERRRIAALKFAEEKRKREEEKQKREEEKQKRKEEFKRNLPLLLKQQETPVNDEYGNRWIQCERCGKIATDSDFTTYGGKGHTNLGICKECAAISLVAKGTEQAQGMKNKPKFDITRCPECGGKLVERNGRNGKFFGCSGYPLCRFTRSIKG
jgi:hypothetical protein